MQKKLVSLILAAVLLLAAVPGATAFAADVVDSGTCGDDLTWTLTSDGVLTISGTGEMWKGSSWYSVRSNITSAVINSGVTSIGEKAFEGCRGMTDISIPGSVTSIGKDAFVGCYGLTSINISTVNTNYSSVDGILFDKDKTVLIKYPAGKTEKIYTIPSSVTNIGEDAFECCKYLTNVKIPNSVTSIGTNAFAYCYNITGISIPSSITNIENYAFYSCDGLKSINIPNSVTSIGSHAFEDCFGLKSVNISDSVISIGEGAFKNCTSLTSLSLPDSVKSIGESAFHNCNSMTSVSIPSSVTSIGEDAFGECISLTGVELPSSVTVISNNMFYRCLKLTSVSIPDSVTSIGSNAFYKCTGLTSISIPDSVTSIGSSAFYKCTGLTSISIPDSVTSIGNIAFYNTGYYNNKDNWDGDVLYIRNYLIDARESLSGAYSVKDGCKLIAESAFQGCGLASVELPGSVESIGNWAFHNCDKLISVSIPYGVTAIGENTFSSSDSLKSVKLPGSVTSIGSGAFRSCDSLADVYYSGTEKQWQEIVIGTDNDALTGAAIHYEDVAPEPEITNAAAVIEDVAVTVTVKTKNVPANASIIAVGYGLDGKYIDCAEVKNGIARLDKDAKTVKVFAWKSLGSMLPLCEGKTVTVE